MKIYYSIIVFIFAFSLNAQESKTSESTNESLAESEMKSAARLQSAAVNPNTLNYEDRKSTRLNSSHVSQSRMPSSA